MCRIDVCWCDVFNFPTAVDDDAVQFREVSFLLWLFVYMQLHENTPLTSRIRIYFAMSSARLEQRKYRVFTMHILVRTSTFFYDTTEVSCLRSKRTKMKFHIILFTQDFAPITLDWATSMRSRWFWCLFLRDVDAYKLLFVRGCRRFSSSINRCWVLLFRKMKFMPSFVSTAGEALLCVKINFLEMLLAAKWMLHQTGAVAIDSPLVGDRDCYRQ